MNKSTKPLTLGRALTPLIIFPITAIVDIILLATGAAIDSAMYNPQPDMPGFMFPAVTIVFILIGAVISLIALIVMIVLLSVNLSKYNKAKKI